MIATSLRFAKEHERRGNLIAELENTSIVGGFVKSPKADFREAMRLSARATVDVHPQGTGGGDRARRRPRRRGRTRRSDALRKLDSCRPTGADDNDGLETPGRY